MKIAALFWPFLSHNVVPSLEAEVMREEATPK